MDPFHVVSLAASKLDECRRRVQRVIAGRRGRASDPLYRARRTLHTGADLLTDTQARRLQALRRCGLLDVPATDLPDGTPPRHVDDKGYIGLGMITPKRKPANLPLHPDDKTYNTTVNQIRYKIERVITNIKTWRVLHTGYRRPPETFPETITTILATIFTHTPRKSLPLYA